MRLLAADEGAMPVQHENIPAILEDLKARILTIRDSL